MESRRRFSDNEFACGPKMETWRGFPIDGSATRAGTMGGLPVDGNASLWAGALSARMTPPGKGIAVQGYVGAILKSNQISGEPL